MKRSIYKYVLVGFTLFAIAGDSIAQQRPTRRRPAETSAYGQQQPAEDNAPANSAYGNDPEGAQNNPSDLGAGNRTFASIDTTLPITVVNSSSNGLIDSAKMSLRTDGAFEKNLLKTRTPLEYENIREDDAVYVVRVWREIDAREKLNLPFRNGAVEDNGSQRFISIMLKAIQDGDVTAFSGDDDRFTTPITSDEALSAFGGGSDTSSRFDMDGNVVGYEVRAIPVEPDSIYKFRIKEEWVFDKESSRLFVRILGIAPVVPYKLSTGEIVPGSDRAVWWVYYPDLRPVLSGYTVYNSKNYGAKMTWEELFEGRMFTSYIVKSTIDNPYDLNLAAMYPNNTLFRLLEGERIKDNIFNYEQSLWSY